MLKEIKLADINNEPIMQRFKNKKTHRRKL